MHRAQPRTLCAAPRAHRHRRAVLLHTPQLFKAQLDFTDAAVTLGAVAVDHWLAVCTHRRLTDCRIFSQPAVQSFLGCAPSAVDCETIDVVVPNARAGVRYSPPPPPRPPGTSNVPPPPCTIGADDGEGLAAEPLAQEYAVASCLHPLVAPNCGVPLVRQYCLSTCRICAPASVASAASVASVMRAAEPAFHAAFSEDASARLKGAPHAAVRTLSPASDPSMPF